MVSLDSKLVKQALLDAGLEIYRSRPDEIQIAERLRLHIMDSHVRVGIGRPMRVWFTARSQRSDFPTAEPAALVERVRRRVGGEASERGFVESATQTHEVKDPLDDSKTLDVWHEVIYAKALDDLDTLIAEVRWALSVEKFVRD